MVSLKIFNGSYMPITHLQIERQSQNCIQCNVEAVSPFNELLLSWNATRPEVGHFLFFFRLKTAQLHDFMPYALWGASGQKSYTADLQSIKVNQDTIVLKEGLADGFSVKVEAQNGADITDVHALIASYTNHTEHVIKPLKLPQNRLQLDVPTLSQRRVDHPRKNDLCSPTSTCALCSFLTKKVLNPLSFATNSWDSDADIYGNWVFAIAEASHHLGNKWLAYVTRLTSFDEVTTNLKNGIPSIISVRGPLPGSPVPNTSGHLLVVTGFDGATNKIFCMDPAFHEESETVTAYDANDLFAAWKLRGGVAYIFKKFLKKTIVKIFPI